MEELFGTPTLKELGFGGAMGFILGFTFKRIFKFLTLLLGLYILSLIWLADKGIISVNWSGMELFAREIFSSLESFAKASIRAVAFSGSFAVGFMIGMKV